MASWLQEYMVALKARDAIEKADSEVYNAYARLADRAASLMTPNPPAEPILPAAPPIRPSGIRSPPPPSTSPSTHLADLKAAQSARSSLQTQLSNLQTTHDTTLAQLKSLRSAHASLMSQNTTLQTRFKDRDSELRGKAKLLENLQDELATTEMELTLQGQAMEKLREENRTLVERWMKKVGDEAEEMNVALESEDRRRPRSVIGEEEAGDTS